MPYDMNIGANPTMNPGNPTRHPPEIMHDMDELIQAYACYNKWAMRMCQKAGYNGFKRMHRWNAKKFTKLSMKLQNEAYDKFRFELMADAGQYPTYPYTNLSDHLKHWDMWLDKIIDHMVMLNNEYRECAGMGNCIAEKALCIMTKNHEKTGRWYKRFEETKSAHDQHELDDWLHAKYKAKEEHMRK